MYKKSGVIVSDICDAGTIQRNFFDSIQNRKERVTLMKSIDSLNMRFGLKTVQLAIEGNKNSLGV